MWCVHRPMQETHCHVLPILHEVHISLVYNDQLQGGQEVKVSSFITGKGERCKHTSTLASNPFPVDRFIPNFMEVGIEIGTGYKANANTTYTPACAGCAFRHQ